MRSIGFIGHIGFVGDNSGAGGEPVVDWFNAGDLADYAVVADFTNNRYAMPALDEEGAPILTRDANGRYPKREVTVVDVMSITRPAPIEGEFSEGLWSTYSRKTGEWSLLGGDGTGNGVPRLESWMGPQGLYVEPAGRFNRVQDSDTLPSTPRLVGLSRGAMAYTVTWVGNDDLICTVAGFPDDDVTLPARDPNDPHGLNWGFLPVIAGWNGTGTLMRAAGNPGTVLHSLAADTQSNEVLRPPMTMVATSDFPVDGNGNVHVERGPERVRMSDSFMALVNDTATGRMRSGTIVIDQQQFIPPQASSHRFVLGGHTAGANFGPVFLGLRHNGTGYEAIQETGFNNSNMSIALTEAETTARCKMGLAMFNEGGPCQRRVAITGHAAVSTGSDANYRIGGTPAFYLFSGAPSSDTDYATLVGGAGAVYSIMWSPDFMSEDGLLDAVGN